MAKIKYAAGATPILNEHNGYTFQPNNYGQSVFPAQKNDRYRRPRQTETMAYNQRCVKAWRTLSGSSQTAWETFAATYPQPTKADASVFLTGYQLFVKRNFYCLQNQGVNEDLITDPLLKSLPNPDFSIEITADKNTIDFTSQYVKYFGIIPEPGQFVICKVLPYAEKSGQFFTPFIATLEVLDVYVDGLFGSFSFVGNLPGIIFSVFLSKPFWQSQQYAGTKYRYMGCFKPSTFLELTDTPSSYVGQAGKVPAVKSDESGLEFIDAGGGGLTCADLPDCPTIQQLQDQINTISEIVIPIGKISVPPVHYGLLYNWYVVGDARNIANTGWHVPSRAEFKTLETYLGGSTVAGGKLKETGLIYWYAPNTGATNVVEFNGRGSGDRQYSGAFTSLNLNIHCWTTDYAYATNYYTFFLAYNTSASQSNGSSPSASGYSIRLLKDSTTLSDGETGTYIGNNGKAYRTICIGTQEWLADNLAETKFSDGTDIPEITDATAWAADTDGALCAYDNDWANV